MIFFQILNKVRLFFSEKLDSFSKTQLFYVQACNICRHNAKFSCWNSNVTSLYNKPDLSKLPPLHFWFHISIQYGQFLECYLFIPIKPQSMCWVSQLIQQNKRNWTSFAAFNDSIPENRLLKSEIPDNFFIFDIMTKSILNFNSAPQNPYKLIYYTPYLWKKTCDPEIKRLLYSLCKKSGISDFCHYFALKRYFEEMSDVLWMQVLK